MTFRAQRENNKKTQSLLHWKPCVQLDTRGEKMQVGLVPPAVVERMLAVPEMDPKAKGLQMFVPTPAFAALCGGCTCLPETVQHLEVLEPQPQRAASQGGESHNAHTEDNDDDVDQHQEDGDAARDGPEEEEKRKEDEEEEEQHKGSDDTTTNASVTHPHHSSQEASPQNAVVIVDERCATSRVMRFLHTRLARGLPIGVCLTAEGKVDLGLKHWDWQFWDFTLHQIVEVEPGVRLPLTQLLGNTMLLCQHLQSERPSAFKHIELPPARVLCWRVANVCLPSHAAWFQLGELVPHNMRYLMGSGAMANDDGDLLSASPLRHCAALPDDQQIASLTPNQNDTLLLWPKSRETTRALAAAKLLFWREVGSSAWGPLSTTRTLVELAARVTARVVVGGEALLITPIPNPFAPEVGGCLVPTSLVVQRARTLAPPSARRRGPPAKRRRKNLVVSSDDAENA